MCHELHKDTQRDQVFTSVLSFIEKRLASPSVIKFQVQQMKQGLHGERVMSMQARILTLVIYIYLGVGLTKLFMMQNKSYLLRWLQLLKDYLTI